MKFIKGFIIGTFVGVTIGTAISEQQRQEIVQRVKKQAEPVGRAVSDNVRNVADTVTQRAAGAVDDVGATAVDSIEDHTPRSPEAIGMPRPI